MLGRIVRSQNDVPVARIMACLEVVMQVGPRTDFPRLSAFVDAMLVEALSQARSVCDNRDFFTLRAIRSGDRDYLHDALHLACGVGRPSQPVDWATMSYFDNPDGSSVPATYVSCSLGLCRGGDREVAISLVVGLADDSAWETLSRLSNRLAADGPGLWRSMTVARRFCPLDYNGVHLAHQAIHRLARRMPAVDVGDTLAIHAARWTDRLRTVGWTTFVNDELAARCEHNAGEPMERVDLWQLSGGAIRASLRDGPAAGDDAGEDELRGYIEADRFFRAVRADDITFLPPWNDDTSREWLCRWEPGGISQHFLSP